VRRKLFHESPFNSKGTVAESVAAMISQDMHGTMGAEED